MQKDIKYTVIKNEKHLLDYFHFITQNEVLAFDLETSGVNPRQDEVMGIGVSNGSEGFYLPRLSFVKDINDICPQWPKNRKQILGHCSQIYQEKFLAALVGKKLIAWGGAFEAQFCKEQLNWSFIEHFHADGMLQLHLVDENKFNYGLKENAEEMYGSFAVQPMEEMLASVKANGGSGKEYYKADTDALGKYCVWDCVLTYWMWQHNEKRLVAEGLHDFFYKDEVMPLYKYVTIPMEATGIKLDMEALQSSKTEIEQDLADVEAKIQEAIAPHLALFTEWFLNKDYPPSRTGAFAQGIAEFADLPLPRTKSGKYSLTEKAIEALPESLYKQVLLKNAYLPKEDVAKIQALLYEKDAAGKQYMFNLSSKHHLKKLFFDTLQETPLSTTDLGNPQVDEEFILAMGEKYEWCKWLRIYNKLVKIKGAYIERFLDGAEDGRFYPQFFQHRTVSGRYAGDLQQLSRPLEEGEDHELVIKYTNRIRTFFIADEGHIFVDADYNSAEPRVFSYISGDQGLKDIFEKNLDFYSHIAIMTEKLEGVSAHKKADNYLGKVNPSKRQQAKAYSLGCPYGMTGYKLAFQLNCTTEEGDKLINNYLTAFPGLKNWMDKTAEFVCKNGFIKTEAGRIRHLSKAKDYFSRYGLSILNSLELWKKYHEQPAVYAKMKQVRKELKNYLNNANNFQIQGLVSSIINRSCIATARQFKEQNLDAVIVATVHDQVIVHCEEKDKEQVARILQDCLENTYKIGLPMPAEPNFGRNFKESKG